MNHPKKNMNEKMRQKIVNTIKFTCVIVNCIQLRFLNVWCAHTHTKTVRAHSIIAKIIENKWKDTYYVLPANVCMRK